MRLSVPGILTRTAYMKTDIRETDGSFELDIDMPGFNKEGFKGGAEGRLPYHQRFHEQR